MGYVSTDALGEALRKGEVSMDDFMDTIIKLNKNGTGEFKSFEEQAKNSVGGIGTSIKNMKTAVVRGVASIIQSIDEGLKDARFGGIAEIVSKIGKIAENVLKQIGQGIRKLMPTIKSIYDWIIKNQGVLKTLAVIILSVIAAIKVYNALLLVTKAINIASSIASTVSAFLKLIPAVTSAKDAMILFNAVTRLNPYVVITAAIMGLVAAIAILRVQANSFDGLREKVEEQRKSWEELKKSRQDAIEGTTSEISVLQAEADELRNITDENGKVKEGYENRAQYILNDLNKALGTEYKMNDGIISQYQDLKDNIDQLIVRKKAEAMLDAYKSEYAEAMKKKAEAVNTLTDLYKKLNEKQKETARTSTAEVQKEMDIKKINKLIKDQTELIGEYGYTIEKYENLTSASVSNNKDEIDKALNEIGISYDKAKVKTNQSLIDHIKDQQNYNNLLQQSWNDAILKHDNYQQSLIQEQVDSSQKRLNELAKSLAKETSTVNGLTDEQRQAWKNLADNNIQAYYEGLSSLDENTRKQIEQATGVVVEEKTLPNGMKTLAAKTAEGYKTQLGLSGITTTKINEAKGAIDRSDVLLKGGQKLAGDIKGGLNTFNAEAEGAGATKSYARGMSSPSAMSMISSAAQGISSIISSFLHHTTPDVGPMKDDDKWMVHMVENFAKGIDNSKYKVLNSVDSLSNDIQDRMQNAVNIETGKMNASANIKASSLFDNTIVLNASFDGNVELDKTRVGRIIAPNVARTIKAGGLV